MTLLAIASGDALSTGATATAMSLSSSTPVEPSGRFARVPSSSPMSAAASAMPRSSPTTSTRRPSAAAMMLGRSLAGSVAKSWVSCTATSGAASRRSENARTARRSPEPATSRRAIVSFNWSILARVPRATIALVRGSAAMVMPPRRFSSSLTFWLVCGLITYSTTRSPMSAVSEATISFALP
ncbi:MAG: hypothetical protein U0575_10500 [Phycisphaerales bacterium]